MYEMSISMLQQLEEDYHDNIPPHPLFQKLPNAFFPYKKESTTNHKEQGNRNLIADGDNQSTKFGQGIRDMRKWMVKGRSVVE